jgi:acyl dehydratase
MAGQIFWEDVIVGAELPPLVKTPTTRQLVQYAGASGDFYEIHYDQDFARETGLSGVIVHGALKSAFLGQLVTDWAGPGGSLQRLTCQYRGIDYPNQPIAAKGAVTRKYQSGEQYLVDCTIWLENRSGENTTPGTATVALPSRAAGTG